MRLYPKSDDNHRELREARLFLIAPPKIAEDSVQTPQKRISALFRLSQVARFCDAARATDGALTYD